MNVLEKVFRIFFPTKETYEFCNIKSCTEDGTELVNFTLRGEAQESNGLPMTAYIEVNLQKIVCADHYSSLMGGVTLDWDY